MSICTVHVLTWEELFRVGQMNAALDCQCFLSCDWSASSIELLITPAVLQLTAFTLNLSNNHPY